MGAPVAAGMAQLRSRDPEEEPRSQALVAVASSAAARMHMTSNRSVPFACT
jgi:hypothetical protein